MILQLSLVLLEIGHKSPNFCKLTLKFYQYLPASAEDHPNPCFRPARKLKQGLVHVQRQIRSQTRLGWVICYNFSSQRLILVSLNFDFKFLLMKLYFFSMNFFKYLLFLANLPPIPSYLFILCSCLVGTFDRFRIMTLTLTMGCCEHL